MHQHDTLSSKNENMKQKTAHQSCIENPVLIWRALESSAQPVVFGSGRNYPGFWTFYIQQSKVNAQETQILLVNIYYVLPHIKGKPFLTHYSSIRFHLVSLYIRWTNAKRK